MLDEQSAPQGTGFRQDDWKVDNLTQIAQQTVHNTYITKTGETPSEADEKRHFFTVPFPRNADFVGRESDLTNLHAALTSGDPADSRPVGILPAGLTGQGGMGKTALAVEYCYRHKDDYAGGVFWVNAAEPLAQGFAALGCHIDPANFDRPLPRQIDAAARYLHSHPDVLLVLDNVEDPATLSCPVAMGLIPAELPCRVIFTTRRHDLPRRCRAVEVKVLPPDAALSLLLSQRDGMQTATGPAQKIAAEICAILGYLPLALEIAAAHLRRPQLSLTQYRDALLERGALAVVDDPRGRVRADNLTTRHTAAVAATLAEQWESLECEDARLLLRVAGQLPEAAQIPIARLGLLAGISDVEDIFGSPLEVAVTELENASLIEKLRDDGLRLHPLVREFAAARTPVGNRDDFRAACAENLYRALSDFTTLERHCARRGIATLEDDLRTALVVLPYSHDASYAPLDFLLRVLQRESHILRQWNQASKPLEFAKRINAQAARWKSNTLTQSAAIRISELESPSCIFHWRTEQISLPLIRTLSGHTAKVCSIAVTSDGQHAISASEDHSLCFWDLRTGEAKSILKRHTSPIRSVTLTSDANWAVSASDDWTLGVWNLVTRKLERWLIGHRGCVVSVAIVPNTMRAVSASDDGDLHVWDISTGRLLQTFSEFDGRINSLDIWIDRAGCPYVVSGSDNGAVRLWNIVTGQRNTVVESDNLGVRYVRVSPDRCRLVIVFEDSSLLVLNLDDHLIEHHLIGQGGNVNAVMITPDNREILSVSSDGSLWAWDITLGEVIRTLQLHDAEVNCLAISANGQFVLSASSDCTLKMWHWGIKVDENTLVSHRGSVFSLVVTTDGRRAISASRDGTVLAHHLKTGESSRILGKQGRRFTALTISPSGTQAISASDNGVLEIWNFARNKRVFALQIGYKESVSSLAISLDGSHCIAGCDDGSLKILNLKNRKSLAATTPYQSTESGIRAGVVSVGITEDGRYAASVWETGELYVTDLETEDVYRSTGIHFISVMSDGRYAVSREVQHLQMGFSLPDSSILIWDLRTGEALSLFFAP